VLVVQLGPPASSDPTADSAPVIDYVSASQGTVPPGTTVRLEAQAHDPDPLDSITVQWSATCGVFDDPTRGIVAWRAPAADGPCQIRVTVSDRMGASAAVYLPIDVLTPAG